jgi:hypothetical protein
MKSMIIGSKMQALVVKASSEWCVSIACSWRLGVHGSIPEEDSWVSMHNLSLGRDGAIPL